MASQMPRLATAFSRDKQRKPRRFAADHLAFIRRLPSVVSGSWANIEAAHIRYTDPDYQKQNPGVGMKPDDCWCVPLTAAEHREQHAFGDEKGWWASKGIDPCLVALKLFARSGNDAAGEAIISEARKHLVKP
jgi:hypothetical protein